MIKVTKSGFTNFRESDLIFSSCQRRTSIVCKYCLQVLLQICQLDVSHIYNKYSSYLYYDVIFIGNGLKMYAYH